ncbi:hypothetical protein B0H12DRAFT_1167778, partial [Mycena haematopus]
MDSSHPGLRYPVSQSAAASGNSACPVSLDHHFSIARLYLRFVVPSVLLPSVLTVSAPIFLAPALC